MFWTSGKIPCNLTCTLQKTRARHIRDTNEKNTFYFENKKPCSMSPISTFPTPGLCGRHVHGESNIHLKNNGKRKDRSDLPFVSLCHPRFKWWQLALDRFPRNPGETKARSGNKGAHMNRCRFTSIPTHFLRFASCQMITGSKSWHRLSN